MKLPTLHNEHTDTSCGGCDIAGEACQCGGVIHRERHWVDPSDAWRDQPNDGDLFDGRAAVHRYCSRCGLDCLIHYRNPKP